jgi:phosphatidylglycerol:prolipoprotein diacylglycerol transferase
MVNLDAVAQPVILALSWLLATLAVKGRARAAAVSFAVLGDLSWWVALGALAGARLAYVLGHWQFFALYPMDVLLTIWYGLSFYGGLVGALVAGIWYARRSGLSAWVMAAVAAPALPLGIALARLTYLGYGWWRLGAFEGGLPVGAAANLLEALVCLGMFVSTSQSPRRGAPSPFLLTVIGYGLVRAMADLLRPQGGGPWLLSDQALAIGLALAGAIVLVASSRRTTLQKTGVS